MNRTHNFPDKLVIVLKTRTNQGFIALDDKSVESGITWSGWYRGIKDGDKPYELLEYDNGHFRLKLSKAAERSYSQGGKLSFWTLEVTAPDGRVFDVGINSDSLIETMFETTMINGDIQGEFYLGRTNAQQSIARKNSLYYNEYIELTSVKKSPLTKNYKIGNTIINNREEYIYVGPFVSYIEVELYGRRSHKDSTGMESAIKLRKKLKPVEQFSYAMKRTEREDSFYYSEQLKKMGGRIIDDTELEPLNIYVTQRTSEIKDYLLKRLKEKDYWYIESYLDEYLMYKGITEVDVAIKELEELGITEFIRILK